MRNTFTFCKIRTVKSPVRGTEKSAGIDFFVPTDGPQIINVMPHERTMIPSGLKVVVPDGLALIMFNKSGVASKKGLAVMACVVDEDYRGEVFINVVNTTPDIIKISAGEKLVQGLLIPVANLNPVEMTSKQYKRHEDTERGEGGFGHTGDK